ncbi:ATP-binding cassette domain-containing protein [Streptomyces spectabilis]|uniref:ABC-2 type transport system ATP-binding protein n=1 Tax=Streptomyces spectabilis TaxID=68270 RepID=A0A5P2XHQ1_STRST|nr:ATP-binding cassette domain-containing protein [Streptomyces spectabilis]MBB5106957.1 ABC-2 type transport system ATP-binding protein [Streptomyces spectabilis]MCI3906313.1 ATP-binding cassette domain-containing protein [Streptomyces spectabilis]QEV63174.1 ATP-binding cassette domain-containing protein [Streptomyces spectabilis]GGV41474.1 daunorubicin resistance protein DrrA family ABC transporter ATP-binding protein [Streptomyces spectabilis]
MTATIRTTGESRGIFARGLRKAYGGKVVLDGVDLDVMPGTVFALLGPNGAGKTTTVRILSTLIGADEGWATVAGHSLREAPDAVRAEIGVSGQYAAVDGLLTVEENLLLIADLLHLGRAEGKRRAAELLERFALSEVARKVAASLSGRTRRKLHLAMTLVGRPGVVFLDEPTTGLDPRVRRTMWDLIRDLAASGTTVFLTTQYLEEADQLADRIAVLDGGRIVAEGTAEELKRRIPGGHIRLRFTDIRHLNAATDRLALSTVTRDDTELTLQVSSDGRIPVLRAVLDVLEASGIQAEALTVHTPDLDDVFLALTGRDRGAAARPR